MSSPAGWYPHAQGWQRYWDGEQWTERFTSVGAAERTVALAQPTRKQAAVSRHAAASPGRGPGVGGSSSRGGQVLAVLVGAPIVLLLIFSAVTALTNGPAPVTADPPVPSVTAVVPTPSTTPVDARVNEPVSVATPTPGRLAAPVPAVRAGTAPVAPSVLAKPAVAPRRAPRPGPASGATALCKDGTLSYKAHRQGSCASHGGIAVFYKKI